MSHEARQTWWLLRGLLVVVCCLPALLRANEQPQNQPGRLTPDQQNEICQAPKEVANEQIPDGRKSVGQNPDQEQALHKQIDRLIDQSLIGPRPALASDAEFLRRVTLDLTGSIPSAADARSFLENTSADKRRVLIDQLLASSQFHRHFARVLDVMLMERRGDKHVKRQEWEQYLITSLEKNKKYNRLAAEILAADGADAKLRAPAKFYLEREVEPNLLTREVGRMFFGMDLECAQCHDHPLIDGYLQSDYYGIYAFLNRSYLFQPDTKKPAVLAEKADGEVKFKSVFTGDDGATRPRLPGHPEIDEPDLPPDQLYVVAPDKKNKKVRPIPKYSRRANLARLATDGSNEAFNRNIANRLWAHMMGRGIVHPVDLHHQDNPPSHPQLLDLLARSFVDMEFDMKKMLGEIARTEAYQRSITLPDALHRDGQTIKQQIAQLEEKLPQARKEFETLQHAKDTQWTACAEAEKQVAVAANRQATARENLEQGIDALESAADRERKAQNQLLQSKEALALLTESLTKLSSAQRELRQDEQLAEIAARLHQHTANIDEQVAMAMQEMQEHSALRIVAEKQRDAAHRDLQDATRQLDGQNENYQRHQQQLAQLEQDTGRKQDEIHSFEQQIALGDLMVEFSRRNAELSASRDALLRVDEKLKSAENTRQQARNKFSAIEEQVAGCEALCLELRTELRDLGVRQQAATEAIDLMSGALSHTSLAAKLIPGDDESVQITAGLTSYHQRLQDELSKGKAKSISLTDRIRHEARQLKLKKTELSAAKAKLNAIAKTVEQRRMARSAARETTDRAEVGFAEASDALYERATERFAVAAMKPLSPEQIGWSVMQATGQSAVEFAAAQKELDKKKPLQKAQQKDKKVLAERRKQIESSADARLKGNVTKFVSLFAAAAGSPQDDFFATVDQALFLANSGEVGRWLAPRDDNLADRLMRNSNTNEMLNELYLSILTRYPTREEVADMGAYLDSKPDRSAAIREVIWALMTSVEFRFNH